MPLKNVHACVIKPESAFEPGSLLTMEQDHDGKKYQVLIGKLKGESATSEHSYHYDTAVWKESEAKSHCADHKGEFEPAATDSGDGKKTACLPCGQRLDAAGTNQPGDQGVLGDAENEPTLRKVPLITDILCHYCEDPELMKYLRIVPEKVEDEDEGWAEPTESGQSLAGVIPWKQLYSPDQPRDERGRFGSGGSEHHEAARAIAAEGFAI